MLDVLVVLVMLVNDLRGLRVFKACSPQLLLLLLAHIEVVTLIDCSKIVV